MKLVTLWFLWLGTLLIALWVGTQLDGRAPVPLVRVECDVSDVGQLEQRIDRLHLQRSLRDQQLETEHDLLERRIRRNGCAARHLGNTQPGRYRLSAGLDAKLPLLSECGEFL